MSKAVNGHSASRRRFLVAASAATVAGSIPAKAASTGVTPELAKMIEEWTIARQNYLRLKAIDDAATEAYYRTAPEIPERIIASKIDYIFRIKGSDGSADTLVQDYPKEQRGHLRFTRRRGRHANTLKPSWWRLKLSTPHNFQRTAEWTENIRIAEEFEAADDVAHAAAGVGSVDDELEAAYDLVIGLDHDIEEFDAQSFADIAAIARVSKVIVEERELFQESWDNLIANIAAVAERQGV